MDLIYFIYGLSFVVMALTIFNQYDRSSRLDLSGLFWLLAAFGLVHGLREWMDLWRVVRGDGPGQAAARSLVLAASFVFLFEFGRRLLRQSLARGSRYRPFLGPALYVFVVAGGAVLISLGLGLDVASRLLLGFPGGLFTGLGFWRAGGRLTLSKGEGAWPRRGFQIAGLAFVAYGVFGGLVVPGLAEMFPIPIQVPRTVCAFTAAIAVGFLLKAFHLEGMRRLQDSERRMRLFFERQIVGMAITAPGNGWLQVNDQLCRMLGYSREELLGRSWAELTHPDDVEANLALFDRLLTGEIDSFTLEKRFIAKDGAVVHADVSVGCVRRTDGTVDYVLALIADISERKRAEWLLRQSEERFRSLVEGTTDWVWETDANHVFSWVSSSFEAAAGLPMSEVVGKRRWDLASHEHDIEASRWLAHMEDLAIQRPFRDFRYWMRCRDGKVKWISVDGSPRFDDDGVFLGYRGSGSDITFKAKDSLRLKMLSTAVEQSPVSVVITDPVGTIEYVNAHAAEASGYRAEELIGGNARLFASGQTSAETYRDMWTTIAAGKRWVGEMRNRRKDGELRWETIVIAPVLDDVGAIAHYVAIKQDVTESRLLRDQLRQTNAELEQFAYVASHDLRQPLRMVGSYLTLLEKRLGPGLADDLKEYLGFAVDGARQMDRLILDLLEYSRTGRTKMSPSISVGDTISRALLNLTVAIHDVDAEVVVADDLPSVAGDATELIRLFQNLIGNAVKYRAPDRRPKVEVGCCRQGAEWVLSVKDNGIGMAPEHHERAFGIFQRLVAPGDYEGTGIGLAVCKKIVEHHGGRIWIESALGEGCTFFVALPVAVERAVP